MKKSKRYREEEEEQYYGDENNEYDDDPNRFFKQNLHDSLEIDDTIGRKNSNGYPVPKVRPQ
jgi:hypothetical protein